MKDLSTAYSVRLYEILIAWRSTGKTPVISFDRIQTKTRVLPEEYPRMFDFKKYVLDSALKQINAHTDIQVTYEQHKTGRSITGLSFTFKAKKPPKKPLKKFGKRFQLELATKMPLVMSG